MAGKITKSDFRSKTRSRRGNVCGYVQIYIRIHITVLRCTAATLHSRQQYIYIYLQFYSLSSPMLLFERSSRGAVITKIITIIITITNDMAIITINIINNYYNNSNVSYLHVRGQRDPGNRPTMKVKNITGRRILLCGNQETEIGLRAWTVACRWSQKTA